MAGSLWDTFLDRIGMGTAASDKAARILAGQRRSYAGGEDAPSAPVVDLNQLIDQATIRPTGSSMGNLEQLTPYMMPTTTGAGATLRLRSPSTEILRERTGVPLKPSPTISQRLADTGTVVNPAMDAPLEMPPVISRETPTGPPTVVAGQGIEPPLYDWQEALRRGKLPDVQKPGR